jgi:hypothetical protein
MRTGHNDEGSHAEPTAPSRGACDPPALAAASCLADVSSFGLRALRQHKLALSLVLVTHRNARTSISSHWTKDEAPLD